VNEEREDSILCPNPSCRRRIQGTFEPGSRITCPFCKQLITVPDYSASTVKTAPTPFADYSLNPGEQFGDFIILTKVGEGGMGTVYKAKNRKLNRVVALKTITPSLLAAKPDMVKRFLREAQSAARLEHPNIVRVYSVGEINGHHYIEMQFIQGRTLADVLKERGRLDVEEALRIARGVAVALQCAHENGIIHRDIKPQNIMLTDRGEVMVADFGLAKATESTEITAPGQPLGTPAYMSPEQCEGKSADPRSDIYSLGATLFRMITGKPPFTAETPLALMRMHADTPAPDPREVRQDIPREVATLIRKMLKKRPEERFQSCREIIEAIDRICAPAAPAGAKARRSRLALFGVLALAVVFVLLFWVRSRMSAPAKRGGIIGFPSRERISEIRKIIAQRRADLDGRVISVSKSSGDFRTIAEAVAAAAEGDIIEVRDSATYSESIMISVPRLYIRAKEGESPVIDAGRKIPRCFEVTESADEAIIEGFTCKSATCEGILVEDGAERVILFRNESCSNRWGLKVKGNGALLAANLSHDNESYGIQVSGADARVVDNASFRNSSGVDLHGAQRILLGNNILHSNRSNGVLCRQARDIQVSDNIFYECMDSGVEVMDSSVITILRNQFVRCGRAAIEIDQNSKGISSDMNNIFECRYVGIRAGEKFTDLSEWIRATGLDANSRSEPPAFRNPPEEF